MTEDDHCRLFAETVRTSPGFIASLLSYTKFSGRTGRVRLLYEEQVAARPNVRSDRWWRHWWCKIPELGRERETDIFLVFEEMPSGARFALHIENKLDAPLSLGQAEDYEPRARFMANQKRYLSYSDFATILLCRRDYETKNRDKAALFDVVIHHESLEGLLQPQGPDHALGSDCPEISKKL